ncbi:Protein kinase domain-containing protein [Cinnamomum micranthum f. kanehirae]|uniref:non-specific serine/threonine protein kinase n=1 Tax=Cinnamomum micranthum f. kanehirae TaxID=337451 RepID=A0A443PZW1_9MAGN|nr:Protein kinase domain-containing protein [Cinnamomum micranthum f. kanehirae]
MLMRRRDVVFLFLLTFSCFPTFGSGATLPQDEIDALKQIGQALGKVNRDFGADPCSGEQRPTAVFANNVACNCTYQNNTVCHVVSIFLRGPDLQGVLPPTLAQLRYLQQIDLTRNYFNGSIPAEWGSLPLEKINLFGNRITGPIPKELWNISTLTNLILEANMFSGECALLLEGIEKLVGIKRILISSNAFSGQLPTSLANLTSLKDFMISDNNFTGRIPDFIENWTELKILAIQGSGLQGPIPSGISSLVKLTDLRISDINGTASPFPKLDNMIGIKTLILRNCNLTGSIPEYIWKMEKLKTLDLSFNMLEGQLPPTLSILEDADFIYLTSNLLNGPVPKGLKKVANVDLSYNNFIPASTTDCQDGNLNLFGSPPTANNLSGAVPCLKDFKCSKPLLSKFYINCGGEKVTAPVNGTHRTTTFTEDQYSHGASRYFQSGEHWAFSSTGNFLDDKRDQDIYIGKNISRLTMPDSQLYMTARLSPLSLTYYGFCLWDGSYTVKLHFAEIIISDNSPGKRIFDIYIQGKLVWKDFNIAAEARGAHKAVVKNFTANVTTNTLEIRFYWAGKGTQSIPYVGAYGPLISAISVESDFTPPGGNKIPAGAVIGIVASVFCVIFLIIGILWWKGCFRKRSSMYEDLKRLDLQTGSFTLRQLKAATNNFDAANKIGEGGFGPVYKGLLYDGTIIAVKQLSSKSKQGNREFVNEIGMISALQHPNLVKLYGCCIEGNQLLLVYEYMENNSLARALFGMEEQQLKLDWPTRHHICVGIARGLAYLHEESRLKIVHRDIKATNVLLDKDLNPKISDFGLAKLFEEENTHINTRIAGTIGYMSPEYAMHGYLTDKADVYSFGIVALEIVSGTSNTNYKPNRDGVYLLDWAYVLQERGSLIELVDPKLGSEFNKKEAIGMISIALLCTNSSSTLRPTMSAVVSMLEGRTDAQSHISVPNLSSDDLDIKAIRSHHQQIHSQEQNQSQSQSMSIDEPQTVSSASASDLDPIIMDSDYWSNRE